MPTFACNEGYTISSYSLVCLSGTFKGSGPTCNPNNPCYIQFMPIPTNGYITSSPPYNSGDRVTFACYSGYLLAGASNGVICNSGNFLASPGAPSCTPTPCNGQPTAPNNGYITSVAPYSHLQSVTFVCNNDFTLAPNSGVQCRFGAFVGSTPTCLAKYTSQPSESARGSIVSLVPAKYTSQPVGPSKGNNVSLVPYISGIKRSISDVLLTALCLLIQLI